MHKGGFMTRQPSTDAALVERLRAGDDTAVAELAARYGSKIYQLSFRYMKNREDAEEVAQDVLLKVFRKIKVFRRQARSEQVGHREHADRVRREPHRPAGVVQAPLDHSADIDASPVIHQSVSALMRKHLSIPILVCRAGWAPRRAVRRPGRTGRAGWPWGARRRWGRGFGG